MRSSALTTGRSDLAVSAEDDSRRWQQKQAHYQDPAVVADYDAARFTKGRKRGDTARMLAAARSLLGAEWSAVHSVLDMPCGTGRFAAGLSQEGRRLVAADLSLPMLHAVGDQAAARVAADATALPFADASFDLVVCMRFLFHVPQPLQVEVLREIARVARKSVLVDVRHAWAFSAQSRRLRGCLFQRHVSPRISPLRIDALFAAAGLKVIGKHYFAPGFSEKVLVLARPG